jgi:hypothetical protein
MGIFFGIVSTKKEIDTLINISPDRRQNGNSASYPNPENSNSTPLLLKFSDQRSLVADTHVVDGMANYPCDPLPHLPPGANPIPFNNLRPQHGYVVVGGELPVICDDWAIVLLEPEPNLDAFQGMSLLIRAQFEHRGYHIRQISRCGMGMALVRFADAVDRDNVIR